LPHNSPFSTAGKIEPETPKLAADFESLLPAIMSVLALSDTTESFARGQYCAGQPTTSDGR
jgi:hypothetical protein